MIPRSNASVFIGVAVLVVVAALASAVSALPSGSVRTVQGQTSAFAVSPNGLRLDLQISSYAVTQGGSIVVNITESNTNTSPLNVSAAKSWAVEGLRMNACYSSVYPFGVAIYAGHLTAGSLSSAERINLFPLVPCPLFLRYISGYYFQPSSSSALVLPGSGNPLPMTAGVAASGNYTQGNSVMNFASGEYTVVAGDEWGSVVMLYFVVQ